MKLQTQKTEAKQADLLILDTLGQGEEELTAKEFRAQIEALGEPADIHVDINTRGGSTFEGVDMFGVLDEHPAKVTTRVLGNALSMGSVIFMAGDEREMAANARLMLHNPSAGAGGDIVEMQKAVNMLASITDQMVGIYTRSGQSEETIRSMMAAETWLDAKEALALGFATKIGKAQKVAAEFNPEDYKNVPQRFLPVNQTSPQAEPKERKSEMSEDPQVPQAATIQEIEAVCDDSDFVLTQMKAKATLTQVNEAYATKVVAENDQLKADLEAKQKELDAKAEKKEAKKPGVEPVAEAKAGYEGDPVADWNDALVKALKDCNGDRARALKKVNRDNPELRVHMLRDVNAKARRNVTIPLSTD